MNSLERKEAARAGPASGPAAGPAAGTATPLIKPLPGKQILRDWTGLRLLVLFLALISFGAYLALPALTGPGALAVWLGIGRGFCLALVLGALIIPSVRKFEEWERAVVLRFGKFRRVAGPGLCFLLPLADRVSQVVDIRERVTDFSAQETLTLDSVTVTVDALIFWLVWDPQKAALEVEDYQDAVVLSAKTALRSAISCHDLSTFLKRGDLIEKDIQTQVNLKTTEWGLTVQHIEITDIQIPEKLQELLSRPAQAEREKQARILLAEAEIEIARRLEEAVAVYAGNEAAMKLKILSILNEGLKSGNSMLLVPNSMAEELKTRDIFGLEAINELRKLKNEEERAL
ncbi:MAG: hypothetical protein LBT11_05565 [Treponema sp.]|jgi:regulator of protease activity HflC (stomatin/prohibitin superfamily)|nr:hypothetical protein [Treponema sp.]